MQQLYYCIRCNFPVAYGAVYCNNCGSALAWQQVSPPGEETPVAPSARKQYFYCDENEKVKELQDETRSDVIGQIISMAGNEYRKACVILQSRADYGEAALEKTWTGYYIYPFNEMFDLMAAYFRYSQYPYYPMFKEEINEDECLSNWWNFVRHEIESFFSRNPDFIRSLLVYLAFAEKHYPTAMSNDLYEKYIATDLMNTDYRANVLDYLKSKYASMFDWQKPKQQDEAE